MEIRIKQWLDKTFTRCWKELLMDELIEKSCEERTRQLLELAQTFARKSRRLPIQLTCTDLLNALECMNIFSREKTLLFEIEYK